MWSIKYETDNYITITNPDVSEHFYVSGTNPLKVVLKDTANSIVDAINSCKKQRNLKVSMKLNNELLVLDNGIRVGTTGPIKKAAGLQFKEIENEGRRDLLDMLIKYCN